HGRARDRSRRDSRCADRPQRPHSGEGSAPATRERSIVIRTLLASSLFAVGCAYEITGEAQAMRDYALEISTALVEWSNVYADSCSPANLRAVVAGGEVFADLCGEPEDDSVKGCHSLAPRPTRHVLVIRDLWAHEDRN